MTKTEKLLTWMRADPTGKSLREIQTFLLNLDPETRKHIDPKTGFRYRYARGWWCTNLFENSPYSTDRMGIMLKYCQKINGRWVVMEPIKAPFYKPVKTASYKVNLERKKQSYRDYVAKLPRCIHCNKPQFSTELTHDGACINTMSINGYIIDCQERVWYTVEYGYQDMQLTDLTRAQVNFQTTSTDFRWHNQQFVKSHIVRN